MYRNSERSTLLQSCQSKNPIAEESTGTFQLSCGATKKILLVYPVIPRMTYWSFSTALKMVGKKSAFPPLGLTTVAAMLPSSCELRLIDMNVEPLTDDQLEWADAVFVSAMIVQKESFEEVTHRANRVGVPVVAGGPYPSSAYAELPDVDHFVIGEAENTLGPFWEDFCNGRAKRAYARPATDTEFQFLTSFFGDQGDIRLERKRPNMGLTPTPRFDLLNLNKYRSMSVQASRGCPIGCEFCDIWRRYGKKPRCKPTDNMCAELEELYRLKWRGPVFVVDDNFIGDKRRAKEILADVAKWQKRHKYPFPFYTEVTLTLADDDELLHAFREAGFDSVFIGIETPSEESLRETRKHINTKGSVFEKVQKLQHWGMQVSSGFILGFDNDPEDIGDRMIEFIRLLGIPVAMVGLMQALPETDLYDRLKREGRLLSEASGNNTHSFQTNFITKRPMDDVSADYQRILKSVYPSDLSSYFERCAALRNRWNSPKTRGHFRWSDTRAFFYYLATIPFKSYRWSASKYLVQTLLKKPSFFACAVSLAIQGHHFSEITRLAFEAAHIKRFFAETRSAFSQRVTQYVNNTAQSTEVFLTEYSKYREEILAEARRRMKKLNKDVRQTIRREYEDFIREINETYQQIDYGSRTVNS